MPLVYEPQYRKPGWFDDSNVRIAWFDRDLADITAGPPFYIDADTFYTARVTYTVPTFLFVDPDIIYIPTVRVVSSGAYEILKNEVRGTTLLTGPGPQK